MNHDLKSSAKPSGEVKETSRYKINPADGKLDAKSQREDQGWIKMDVRWAVSDATFNSEFTVIGRTVLLPGIGAKHDIHRHPNAEEWNIAFTASALNTSATSLFTFVQGS